MTIAPTTDTLTRRFHMPAWFLRFLARPDCGRCGSAIGGSRDASNIIAPSGIVGERHGHTRLCHDCSHDLIVWIETKPERRGISQ